MFIPGALGDEYALRRKFISMAKYPLRAKTFTAFMKKVPESKKQEALTLTAEYRKKWVKLGLSGKVKEEKTFTAFEKMANKKMKDKYMTAEEQEKIVSAYVMKNSTPLTDAEAMRSLVSNASKDVNSNSGNRGLTWGERQALWLIEDTKGTKTKGLYGLGYYKTVANEMNVSGKNLATLKDISKAVGEKVPAKDVAKIKNLRKILKDKGFDGLNVNKRYTLFDKP